MKKRIFLLVFILMSTLIYADELYKVKIDITLESGRITTYQYAILTDKGQFIEISFNSNGTYDRIEIMEYTKVGNKYIIPLNIGLINELERDGKDLILRKTGKRYIRITDVNLLGM